MVTSNSLFVWDLEDKICLAEVELMKIEDAADGESSIKSCYSDCLSPLFGVACFMRGSSSSEIRFFRFPANYGRVKSARKTVSNNLYD